jgi:hypothetical protein
MFSVVPNQAFQEVQAPITLKLFLEFTKRRVTGIEGEVLVRR